MDVTSTPQHTTAVIVAGGEPIDAAVVDRLPSLRFVIAADSGLDELLRIGMAVDALVGDLDSASEASVAHAGKLGIPVHRFPADKDATDLELALAYAMDAGYEAAVLIGGKGGRLSHLLGNALVITGAPYAAMRIQWHIGAATISVVRPHHDARLAGSVGDLVSLLPTGGTATGITTAGLRWPLDAATLAAGSTRGISNEMTDAEALITLRSGVLLAIHERILTT